MHLSSVHAIKAISRKFCLICRKNGDDSDVVNRELIIIRQPAPLSESQGLNRHWFVVVKINYAFDQTIGFPDPCSSPNQPSEWNADQGGE